MEHDASHTNTNPFRTASTDNITIEQLKSQLALLQTQVSMANDENQLLQKKLLIYQSSSARKLDSVKKSLEVTRESHFLVLDAIMHRIQDSVLESELEANSILAMIAASKIKSDSEDCLDIVVHEPLEWDRDSEWDSDVALEDDLVWWRHESSVSPTSVNSDSKHRSKPTPIQTRNIESNRTSVSRFSLPPLHEPTASWDISPAPVSPLQFFTPYSGTPIIQRPMESPDAQYYTPPSNTPLKSRFESLESRDYYSAKSSLISQTPPPSAILGKNSGFRYGDATPSPLSKFFFTPGSESPTPTKIITQNPAEFETNGRSYLSPDIYSTKDAHEYSQDLPEDSSVDYNAQEFLDRQLFNSVLDSSPSSCDSSVEDLASPAVTLTNTIDSEYFNIVSRLKILDPEVHVYSVSNRRTTAQYYIEVPDASTAEYIDDPESSDVESRMKKYFQTHLENPENLMSRPTLKPRTESISSSCPSISSVESPEKEDDYYGVDFSMKDLSGMEEEEVTPKGYGTGKKVLVRAKDYFPQKQPDIDCTDLFPADIGTMPAVTVMRIENLRPELLDVSLHGHFCISDSYIILHTAISAINSSLESRLYTWIGSKSEKDKVFCCALFSTWLKKHLGVSHSIQRVSDHDTNIDFDTLFDSIVYEDESYAVESSLTPVSKNITGIRVWRISGRPARMTLVRPCADSLNSAYVYLIDTGTEVIQWNGIDSGINARSKCRILITVILGSSNRQNVIVSEMNQGEEDLSIWDALGERTQGASRDDHIDDTLASLYDASASSRGVNPRENLIHVEKTAGAGFSISMLSSKSVFILDAYSELFLWTGQESSPEIRDYSTTLLALVYQTTERPPWTCMHRIYQGFEIEQFKLFFSDWVEARIQKIKMQIRVNTVPKPLRADIQALYTPHVISQEPNLDIISEIETLSKSLIQATIFVYENGKFKSISNVRTLTSENAFVFLCVYKNEIAKATVAPLQKTKSLDLLAPLQDAGPIEQWCQDVLSESTEGLNQVVKKSLQDLSLDDENKESDDVFCVIHFWSGSKCSPISKTVFKFGVLPQLETLIADLYSCDFKIFYSIAGSEDVGILAYFENIVIVEWQKPSAAKLFHVRKDLTTNTIRASQTPALSTSFNSQDCFILITPPRTFLWVGKNSTADGIKNAQLACQKLDISESSIIYQDAETPEFWTHVVNTGKIPTGSLSPPRLLSCSCSKGYFAIQDIQCLQQNFLPNNCVLIHLNNSIYLWIGKDASEVVKKVSRKSAVVWKEYLGIVNEVNIVEDGKEDSEFRSLFLSWLTE